MCQPKISIVIPVYKAERNVPLTMESLRRQTCRDFEVVFVDDGSPDGSAALIEKTMSDSGINWRLIHQENRGLGGARNTGFLEAKGQWILFLDADDTLQSYAVETCCRLAAQYGDADVIFSQYQNVNSAEALKCVQEDLQAEPVAREQLLRGFLTRETVYLVPGTLYRRDFLRRAQLLHPTIPWSEDQYFMWQVMDKLETAVVSRAVLYNYVHHTGESIMRSTPLEKMLVAYEQYCCLPEKMTDPLVKEYLLPRWCLGCLHVYATRGDKASFRAFWKAVGFSSMCVSLLGFPFWKVRILAVVGLVCPPVLFSMMR